MKKLNHSHPFHLVDPSPWPLFASIAALYTTFGGAIYMHRYETGYTLMSLGSILLIGVVTVWWRDIIREATFEGRHTKRVQKGLSLGIGFFIVSEVIFFFPFFWAFFHSSLVPVFGIGGVWPPVGIKPISPWAIPLLNTLLLLWSGCTLTWSHYALKAGGKFQSLIPLSITIFLAIIFISLQIFEYHIASFSISDSVYGSVFYITTGLHGLHVLIGTIFLFVCAVRLFRNHFARTQHLGYIFAVWYWHFVDVVWILVYLFIYVWGS
jgi:cytochrome c oxidase subunit 3